MGKQFNLIKVFALKVFLVMAIIALFMFAAYAVISDAKTIDFNDRFMIGIFSVRPVSDMAYLKEIGFNCVQTYEKNPERLGIFIIEAQKQGLYSLTYPIDDFKSFSIEKTRDIKEFVSKNSGEKVVWYLADEPNFEKDEVLINAAEALKKVVKSADKDAPVTLTSGWWQDYSLAGAISDILMIDVYPIGKGNFNDDVREVSKHTRQAINAVQQKKPVWAILQAFGYQDEIDSGFGWKREPTYDEMRAMTYLSIINGAKGVFYYTYECHGYKIKKSKQHWNDLQAIVTELNTYLPVLTAEASDQITLDDGKNNGSVEYMVKKYKDKYYLFAVNGTRNSVQATISGRAGKITENLKPLETKIYVFK